MIPPSSISKYKIIRELGRGAMGVVYEGLDPDIGRRVAIKLLQIDLVEEAQKVDILARFKREAQSAGRLAHPHIVTIYEYGEIDGLPYIVMEFIEGSDLKGFLQKGRRLGLEQSAELMVQLLGALHNAHQNGIVHRDVKPANIFRLDDGSIKVVDFGIARVESSELTRTGALIGTPAYMSPEQFLELDADPRSDIFSAGVVFYELLTGDRPFTGSVTTIMQKVLRLDPLDPSALNPLLLPIWDRVVKRALEKRPETRYQSAAHFSEAIRATAVAVATGGIRNQKANVEINLHLDPQSSSEETLKPKKPASTGAKSEPQSDTKENRKRETESQGSAANIDKGTRVEVAAKQVKETLRSPISSDGELSHDRNPAIEERGSSMPDITAIESTRLGGLPVALSIVVVVVLGIAGLFWFNPNKTEVPSRSSDAVPDSQAITPRSVSTGDLKSGDISGGNTTISIAHVGPLTGGIAHLGKDNENGARLAIEEANAAKIKIDGKDAKFVLVAEDDQADPRVGTRVAQKLVDAKVAGVVGHLNSGTTIPSSAIYNQAGIPVITGSATNPKLTEQGFKVVFRTIGRDDQQGPAIATFLAETKKPELVAVIDDATAYGEGIANGVEKTLKAANIRVLPREKGTYKTTDWKAILTKIKGKNADVVFYGGMDATGGPLLQQGRELGVKAVFAFGDGACTDDMTALAGAAADGMLCSQAGLPPQAAEKKFLDAYKKKFNVAPILYAPFTYDGANLLIDAMKRANSADPAKFLPELARSNYKGATGQIVFDEKGDRKDAEMTIFTMKFGKLEPVAVVKNDRVVSFTEFVK